MFGYAPGTRSKPLVILACLLTIASALPLAFIGRDAGTAGIGNARTSRQLPSDFALPLAFETAAPRDGIGPEFIARGAGYDVSLAPTKAVVALRTPAASASTKITIELSGADPRAEAKPISRRRATTHYLVGRDPSRWRRDVPTYERVMYDDVYPGIDVAYYGARRQLEYDFVVAPHADPGQVAVRFGGVSRIELTPVGDLLLHTPDGRTVTQHKPFTYQEQDGVRSVVASSYELAAPDAVGIRLGEYDASKPLVIDPVVSYATYLGGSGSESISAVRADAAGNAYVAGRVESADFPVRAARDAELGGVVDAFVAKFDPAGQLVWSTFLGGSVRANGRSGAIDSANDLALDAAGNIYVVGNTQSADFPVVNAFDPTLNSVSDAFVAKLTNDGTTLLYSTYYGGARGGFGDIGDEAAYSVAVDAAGNAYIAGFTSSLDLPVRRAFDDSYGRTGNNTFNYSDGFVAKLDTNVPGDRSLVYSTYLGTDSGDQSYDLAVDSRGQAYVVGTTGAGDFPYTNPVPGLAPDGANGTFLVKMGADGGTPFYVTPVGGRNFVTVSSVAVDANDNVYVAGDLGAAGFPTTAAAFDTSYNGGSDGFVAKIDPAGSRLIFSTYLGAGEFETLNQLATDAQGNVAVVGVTSSEDFPLRDPTDATRGGRAVTDPYSARRYDVFVTVLDADGGGLIFSTFLGGESVEGARGIAFDRAGNVYVAGTTTSSDFPVVNAFDATFNGSASGGDAFVVKYAAVTPTVTTPAPTPVDAPGSASGDVRTDVRTWTVGGTTQAFVKVTFPDDGYAVADWGRVAKDGVNFVADARFARGAVKVASPSATANIYDLGALAPGRYSLTIRANGSTLQTYPFNVEAGAPAANPVDTARVFVLNQYRDFLSREPDAPGLDFWEREITSCGADAACIDRKRVNTSAAFFLSSEFQGTGYFVYRLYKGALNRPPRFVEFVPEVRQVAAGIVVDNALSPRTIDANKRAFALSFVGRDEFRKLYPDTMSGAEFVDALLTSTRSRISAGDRAALVAELDAGTGTPAERRASVLFKIVDGTRSERHPTNPVDVVQIFGTAYGREFYEREFNRAFVLMQYFGYLRRDPDAGGYAFWLAKLDRFGNSTDAEMVKSFILAAEYRSRFGQP